MRKLTTAAFVVTASLALTTAQAAAHPGHTSCKGYGELTASEAHAGTVASELQSLPRGTVDDLIAIVQVGGTFGDEVVPPFCVPK